MQRSPSVSRTRADRGRERESRPRSAPVLLRNYDFERGYDVEVAVLRGGETRYRDRYYLQPGQTTPVRADLQPGVYTVRVDLDGDDRRERSCELGSGPRHTAVVEVGNGTVALTDGLVA